MDWRAPAAPRAVSGMWALLRARTRRLARFGGSIRGATGMVLGGAGACLVPHPPRTPHDGKPAGWGQTGREGGGSIGFCYWRCHGVCEKPVDWTPQHPANPHGSKQKCPTGFLQNPRVGLFYPRVALFYPRVGFCRLPSPPLSISPFSLRKESEREGERRKTPIHGFYFCNKMYPRVCISIHGFSGDEKRGRSQYWRGFAGCLAPIHASTGRNTYTPPGEGSQ